MHKGEGVGSSRRLSTASSFDLCFQAYRACAESVYKAHCTVSETEPALNEGLKDQLRLSLHVYLIESRSQTYSHFKE